MVLKMLLAHLLFLYALDQSLINFAEYAAL